MAATDTLTCEQLDALQRRADQVERVSAAALYLTRKQRLRRRPRWVRCLHLLGVEVLA